MGRSAYGSAGDTALASSSVERERPDLREWFSDEEMAECPRCYRQTALTTPTGWTVCTECGIVGVQVEKEPSRSESL